MIEKYEKVFNSPESKINVDKSWDHYRDENHPMHQRYRYSITHLYGHVLDVGAGDGFGPWLMCQEEQIEHITCLEIQDKAIERMKENLEGEWKIEIVKGIAEDIQPGGQFDSIHCGHMLEHVLNFEATLEAIQAMCDGTVVISVPINGGRSRQHLREWKSVDEFRKIISQYFEEVEWKEFQKKGRATSLVIIAKKK